jgi:hypothetical protein
MTVTACEPSAGAPQPVIGGKDPKAATGWMWDLTIPTDHDFYIDGVVRPASGSDGIRNEAYAILVHNSSCAPDNGHQWPNSYGLKDQR